MQNENGEKLTISRTVTPGSHSKWRGSDVYNVQGESELITNDVVKSVLPSSEVWKSVDKEDARASCRNSQNVRSANVAENWEIYQKIYKLSHFDHEAQHDLQSVSLPSACQPLLSSLLSTLAPPAHYLVRNRSFKILSSHTQKNSGMF